MLKKLLVYFALLFALAVPAQQNRAVDSLQQVLKQTTSDSVRADCLYRLSSTYWGTNPDSASYYATRLLELGEKTKYKKATCSAYSSFASIDFYKGNFAEAIDWHHKSLKLAEELNFKPYLARSCNNLGNAYARLGQGAQALQYYLRALKINEESGNLRQQGYNLTNIGNVYNGQNNLNEALKYYEAGLKIFMKNDDKLGLAGAHTNIGTIQAQLGKGEESKKSYEAALAIRESIHDVHGISINCNNLGNYYYSVKDYGRALEYHNKGLRIQQETQNNSGIVDSYIGLGLIYLDQKKYTLSRTNFDQALVYSEKTGNLSNYVTTYNQLMKLDSAQGNYKKLAEDMRMAELYRGKLINEENTQKMVELQMQYQFDKKEALLLAEQEKKAEVARIEQARKDALAQNEIDRQKIVRNSFIGGFAIMLLFAVVFFTQRNSIRKGKERSDELLLNILPAEVAEELKEKGSAEARQVDEATVLFTDFKGFTALSEQLSPKALVAEINACFSAFDHIMKKNGVEKIKTIGDSYMAAGGLQAENKSHAAAVVNAALEIIRFMEQHKQERIAKGEQVIFEIRIGIHSGPVVAGIVGVNKFQYDIWGDTVNTASRMESSGEAGKVNISGATYERVRGQFTCTYRGKIAAKGKAEADMYFVEAAAPGKASVHHTAEAFA